MFLEETRQTVDAEVGKQVTHHSDEELNLFAGEKSFIFVKVLNMQLLDEFDDIHHDWGNEVDEEWEQYSHEREGAKCRIRVHLAEEEESRHEDGLHDIPRWFLHLSRFSSVRVFVHWWSR